ncbi:XdhC family protein [Pseudarthrobacter sp. J64]|uniref:XdhC family protein n=1 Tax=Pseudarthrobacter sp. J64 TaxID=3116485 RepID=UPI002E81B7A7|nr:XdhC family protein [Pseudarthrobacter sp. J64]MEE2570343.1 XdhC family protein [Pseudarthrobacter sp. J64]
MLDLMPSLDGWQPVIRGQRCAVATVVAAGGSVPRPVGTSMLVSEAGETLGSLSGGCVEGAVVAAALEAIDDGVTRRSFFGYSAADAFAVGLTCGGELEVHIEPLNPSALSPSALSPSGVGGRAPTATTTDALALIRRVDRGGRGAVVVPDPGRFDAAGSPELAALLDGDAGLVRAAAAQLGQLLRGGGAGLVRLASEACRSGADPAAEPVELLVESRRPAPRFLIFGANDFGAALLPAARLLGYHVTLCDARPAFTAQERFATADSLVSEWPHRYLAAEAAAGRLDPRTVVCVLTHDPKFDIPLLAAALDLDLAYVGAMGSRRSHLQRVSGLLDAGVLPGQLEKLRSPIGLDLGAVTPAEVAVSITSEVLAARTGAAPAGAGPLKNGHGPIHSSGGTSWT